MKREITNNSFTGGLVMDLNPINTPNNVLTNCLNGTLITYNGNENILQNDIGNGRVETAQLPEGYIPLGTAELGGIIYIVSYNPLIDKCQIGSFPSPERNITSSESDITGDKRLNCAEFYNGSDYHLKSSTQRLILLDNELNPGDKFQIASENIVDDKNQNIISSSDILSAITNSTDLNPDKLPRYLKLSVVSIGDDGSITKLNDSLVWHDLQNVNGKYYIKNSDLSAESSNTDLDEYRNLVQSNYNVFSYSGKLGLLAELECIDSFDVSYDVKKSIDGSKWEFYLFLNWTYDNEDDQNKINLYGVKVIDTINDNILMQSDNSNDTGVLQYPIYGNTNSNSNTDILELKDGQYYLNPTPLYNISDKDSHEHVETTPRKNDGTDNQFFHPQSFSPSTSNSKFNFDVYPAMPFGYMDWLKRSFSVNIDKLGTGEFDLEEYRYYYNENDSVTLNWGLGAYPEKNKQVTDVTFNFYNFSNWDGNPFNGSVVNNQYKLKSINNIQVEKSSSDYFDSYSPTIDYLGQIPDNPNEISLEKSHVVNQNEIIIDKNNNQGPLYVINSNKTLVSDPNVEIISTYRTESRKNGEIDSNYGTPNDYNWSPYVYENIYSSKFRQYGVHKYYTESGTSVESSDNIEQWYDIQRFSNEILSTRKSNTDDLLNYVHIGSFENYYFHIPSFKYTSYLDTLFYTEDNKIKYQDRKTIELSRILSRKYKYKLKFSILIESQRQTTPYKFNITKRIPSYTEESEIIEVIPGQLYEYEKILNTDDLVKAVHSSAIYDVQLSYNNLDKCYDSLSITCNLNICGENKGVVNDISLLEPYIAYINSNTSNIPNNQKKNLIIDNNRVIYNGVQHINSNNILIEDKETEILSYVYNINLGANERIINTGIEHSGTGWDSGDIVLFEPNSENEYYDISSSINELTSIRKKSYRYPAYGGSGVERIHIHLPKYKITKYYDTTHLYPEYEDQGGGIPTIMYEKIFSKKYKYKTKITIKAESPLDTLMSNKRVSLSLVGFGSYDFINNPDYTITSCLIKNSDIEVNTNKEFVYEDIFMPDSVGGDDDNASMYYNLVLEQISNVYTKLNVKVEIYIDEENSFFDKNSDKDFNYAKKYINAIKANANHPGNDDSEDDSEDNGESEENNKLSIPNNDISLAGIINDNTIESDNILITGSNLESDIEFSNPIYFNINKSEQWDNRIGGSITVSLKDTTTIKDISEDIIITSGDISKTLTINAKVLQEPVTTGLQVANIVYQNRQYIDNCRVLETSNSSNWQKLENNKWTNTNANGPNLTISQIPNSNSLVYYFSHKTSNKSSYSGHFTENITGLTKDQLYLVEIVINYNNEEKVYKYYRFMYTFDIFNDEYFNYDDFKDIVLEDKLTSSLKYDYAKNFVKINNIAHSIQLNNKNVNVSSISENAILNKYNIKSEYNIHEQFGVKCNSKYELFKCNIKDLKYTTVTGNIIEGEINGKPETITNGQNNTNLDTFEPEFKNNNSNCGVVTNQDLIYINWIFNYDTPFWVNYNIQKNYPIQYELKPLEITTKWLLVDGRDKAIYIYTNPTYCESSDRDDNSPFIQYGNNSHTSKTLDYYSDIYNDLKELLTNHDVVILFSRIHESAHGDCYSQLFIQNVPNSQIGKHDFEIDTANSGCFIFYAYLDINNQVQLVSPLINYSMDQRKIDSQFENIPLSKVDYNSSTWPKDIKTPIVIPTSYLSSNLNALTKLKDLFKYYYKPIKSVDTKSTWEYGAIYYYNLIFNIICKLNLKNVKTNISINDIDLQYYQNSTIKNLTYNNLQDIELDVVFSDNISADEYINKILYDSKTFIKIGDSVIENNQVSKNRLYDENGNIIDSLYELQYTNGKLNNKLNTLFKISIENDYLRINGRYNKQVDCKHTSKEGQSIEIKEINLLCNDLYIS